MKLTVSVEAACGFLGISKSAGYSAAKTGFLAADIRGLRIGRRLVVPRVDLEAVLGPLPALAS